jgi:hypothetical protein
MGQVTYIDRKTGAEVQTEFPLHPGLVTFTKPDGQGGQMFRAEFDQAFAQKAPELPAVDPKNIPAAAPGDVAPVPLDTMGTRPPYAPPTLTPLAIPPGPMPASHHAWFHLLFDEIRKVAGQVEALLKHKIEKTVEDVERDSEIS